VPRVLQEAHGEVGSTYPQIQGIHTAICFVGFVFHIGVWFVDSVALLMIFTFLLREFRGEIRKKVVPTAKFLRGQDFCRLAERRAAQQFDPAKSCESWLMLAVGHVFLDWPITKASRTVSSRQVVDFLEILWSE
jgi:hypothetical protein